MWFLLVSAAPASVLKCTRILLLAPPPLLLFGPSPIPTGNVAEVVVHPISPELSFSPAFDGYVFFSVRDRLIAVGGPVGAPARVGHHREYFSRLWKGSTSELYHSRQYDRREVPFPDTEPYGRLLGVSEDTFMSVTASFFSNQGIQVWDNFRPRVPKLTLPGVDARWGTFHHETHEWIELTPIRKAPIRAFSFAGWRVKSRRIFHPERTHGKRPTRLALCPLGHRWAETVTDSKHLEWLYVWETLTGRRLLSALIPNAREIQFSTDGQFIGAVSVDGTRVYNVNEPEAQPQVIDQTERHLSFSPDNRYVVAGESTFSHAVVWDRSTPVPQMALRMAYTQPLNFSRSLGQPWLAILRYDARLKTSKISLLDFNGLIQMAKTHSSDGSDGPP